MQNGQTGNRSGRLTDMLGNDLLSHQAAPAVPSAQEGLTSVFEMGTGVTPPLSSPSKAYTLKAAQRTR